jgi:hypothetical protein
MVYFLILIISPAVTGLSLNQYDSSYLLLISSIILIFTAVLVFVTKLYQLLVVSLPAWFYINFVTYLRYFTDEILIFKTNTYNIYFKDRFNFKIDIIKDYANKKLSDRSGLIQNELTESNIISKSYDYFFKIIDTLVIVEKEELVVVDPSFFDKYGIYIITGLIVVTAVVVVFLIINKGSTMTPDVDPGVTNHRLDALEIFLNRSSVNQDIINNFLIAAQQCDLDNDTYTLFCQSENLFCFISKFLRLVLETENTVFKHRVFIEYLREFVLDCRDYTGWIPPYEDNEDIRVDFIKRVASASINRYLSDPDKYLFLPKQHFIKLFMYYKVRYFYPEIFS